MTLRTRQAIYVVALLAAMPLSSWAGTAAAWRALLGDDAGRSMATFWDLQVESYVTALLLVAVLDAVYGLHRSSDGRLAFAHRGWRRHLAAYAGLIALAVVCSAEGPLRTVLQLPLPDDVGSSVAHYIRRSLEAVLTVLGLMAFLDLLRPGGLRLGPVRRRRTGDRPRTAPRTAGRGR